MVDTAAGAGGSGNAPSGADPPAVTAASVVSGITDIAVAMVVVEMGVDPAEAARQLGLRARREHRPVEAVALDVVTRRLAFRTATA